MNTGNENLPLVVIASRGHFDYVKRAVESLHAHPPGERADYIIVDDASDEWNDVDWRLWPSAACRRLHFSRRGGLSRSLNAGLQVAREDNYRYAVCANSDVVFTNGWWGPLVEAINNQYALVGPVTNAPGSSPEQDVRRYVDTSHHNSLTDRTCDLRTISCELSRSSTRIVNAQLNGFFLAALTSTWWDGALDQSHVFSPEFPLAHNEVELQHRWAAKGWSSGIAVHSYIFHYRSVSRPEGLKEHLALGAFRAVM